MEKASGLASAVTVRRHPKHAGVLVVRTPLGTERFIRTGDDLFRQLDGNETLAFQRDDGGRVTHFFMGSVPMMAMERIAWYQGPTFHQVLLAITLLLLLSMPIVMVAGWLLRRRFSELPRLPRGARLARWTALLATVATVGFSVALVGVISNPTDLIKGEAGALDIVLAIPILITLLALLMLGFTARAWKHGWWGRLGRAHYTAVSIALLVLIAQLAYWNLLGWKY